MRFECRELLNLSLEDLWKIPQDVKHLLVCSDGDIELVGADMINTILLWFPLLDYPDVPISKDWVQHSETEVSGFTMLQTLNKVLWGIHGFYQERVDTELLALAAIRTVTRWYNVVTVRCSDSISTLSMLDVLEIMDNPNIRKLNDSVKPTRYSVETETLPGIRKHIMEDTELALNPVKVGLLCGTQNINQVLQCFGPRGFVTDINSDIFKEPITTGYAEGIWGLYESMIESRSGTKSLLFNSELLSDTEYFNRMLQLVGQYVGVLDEGDCGTDVTIPVVVTKALLPVLKGKYYKTEEGLKWIRGDETHLLGTTIQMRSVLGCKRTEKGHICSKCYGRLSYSVPRNTNIGHVAAVQLGGAITSSVLSVKHTDVTSNTEKLVLSSKDEKFLTYGKIDEALYLNPKLKGKRVKMTVDRDEASSLTDVVMLNDLSTYPTEQASSLESVMIEVDDEQAIIGVSRYNRRSSFTREALQYIKTIEWDHSQRKVMTIDFSDFDFALPVLILPNRHVNMHEVMKKIRTFFTSGDDNKTRKVRGVKHYIRDYSDNPADGMLALTYMVNEKISINIVHCEVLTYSLMANSPERKDYGLPIPGITGVIEKYNTVMRNRSMGGAMAYEHINATMLDPDSYVIKRRDAHPYDAILMGGVTS